MRIEGLGGEEEDKKVDWDLGVTVKHVDMEAISWDYLASSDLSHEKRGL